MIDNEYLNDYLTEIAALVEVHVSSSSGIGIERFVLFAVCAVDGWGGALKLASLSSNQLQTTTQYSVSVDTNNRYVLCAKLTTF